MIIKTYPNKNLYGNFFLATEAPDDETVAEDTPKPRRNVKVIKVRPSSNRKDFAGIVDDTDDDADAQDQPTQPEPQEHQDDVETTPPAEQPEDDGRKTDDTLQDDQPDTPDIGVDDNTDFSDGADTQDVEPTTDDSATADADAPVTDAAEDFASGSDDAAQDAATTDDAANPTNTTTDKPTQPGVELDSTRKYNLFREYMSLYNACDNYISKLENILKNDYDENQIIRISVNNLREIKDILSDYMTIRFQLNSYVQSLLFYQKMVVSVQLVFNLLKSIGSNKKL